MATTSSTPFKPDAGSRTGWTIVEVYEDAGISGAKGRDKRPAFDRLCKDAARRKFDVVMAWSVDRLGRSLQDLVGFMNELRDLKVDLFLHKQALDTTTSSGRAMFQMLGVFGEFEREMIRERVRSGMARARARTAQERHAAGKKGSAALATTMPRWQPGWRRSAPTAWAFSRSAGPSVSAPALYSVSWATARPRDRHFEMAAEVRDA